MPSKQQHLKQAQKDAEFFGSFRLDHTPYLDWVVTGAFYCALHYVDAYLATKSIHPREHQYRDQCISRDQDLRAIEAAYFKLRDQSVVARYECRTFKPDYVRNLIDVEFATVRDYIAKLV